MIRKCKTLHSVYILNNKKQNKQKIIYIKMRNVHFHVSPLITVMTVLYIHKIAMLYYLVINMHSM